MNICRHTAHTGPASATETFLVKIRKVNYSSRIRVLSAIVLNSSKRFELGPSSGQQPC